MDLSILTSTDGTDVVSTLQSAGIPGTAIAGFFIAVYLMQAIAYIGIFRKAGDSGWKGFIPVLNGYTQLKLTWGKWAFWAMILVGVAEACVRYFIPAFSYTEYILLGLVVLGGILNIIANYKLAKSFGHGIGYTIGLIFFNTIFSLIIGIGASEFIRKEKKTDE